MTDISLATIEAKTTSSNLERGKTSFYSGQVSDFKISNNRFVQAVVNGGKKYKVFIEIRAKGYKAYCNCPYNLSGYCKHQVAVKFALMEDPGSATHINLTINQAKLLKYSNIVFNLFYQIKYKLF